MVNLSSLILLPLWLIQNFISVDSVCTFPSSWSGSWHDSAATGGITITTDQISGWSVTAFSATSTVWACEFEDTTNKYFVFKGNAGGSIGGITYDTYICIRWTEITTSSYYYYRMSDINANANSERVATPVQGTITNYVSQVCNGSPTSPEFFTIVQSGQESAVKQNCPSPLLGTFSFTYDDGSTSTTCSGNSWDVCSDRTTMSMTLGGCTNSIKVAYSTSGIVYCATAITDSTDSSIYYVSVLNSDASPDGSTTFRMSCFAVKSTSSTTTVASEIRNACENGQTPTTRPTNGATISLTASVTCPFTTSTAATTTTTTSASSGSGETTSVAAAAAGGALAAIAVIGVIVVVVILVKKFKSPRKVNGISHDVNSNGIPEKENITSQPNSPRDAVDIETTDTHRLAPIERKPSVVPGLDTRLPKAQTLPPINKN